jgi:hypothetical protein
MGLGKTICALAALQAGAPVVIVSPKNMVGGWLREFCMWRPDYGSCRIRKRKELVYLEPDKGIKILEGIGGFSWPKPGEVVILGYSILPLTPAEYEDAQNLVDEWDRHGGLNEFTWTPPGAKEPVDVEEKEIKAALRLIDSKAKPVTAPPEGTVLIFDEAHSVKQRDGQRQSNRARRFKALAEYVRANGGRTWAGTGTRSAGS